MKLRWSNEEEVRRSLAKVNNMLLSKEMHPSQAKIIISAAGLIVDCIKIRESKKNVGEDR